MRISAFGWLVLSSAAPLAHRRALRIDRQQQRSTSGNTLRERAFADAGTQANTLVAVRPVPSMVSISGVDAARCASAWPFPQQLGEVKACSLQFADIELAG
jgi:hypothetical protein